MPRYQLSGLTWRALPAPDSSGGFGSLPVWECEMVGLEGQVICHAGTCCVPAAGDFWSSSSIFLWRGESEMLEQDLGAAEPRLIGDQDRSWVKQCRSDHGIMEWFGMEGF